MLKATVRPIHGGSNGDFFILEVESDQHIQLDRYGNNIRFTVYLPTSADLTVMGLELISGAERLDKAHEMC